MPYTPEQYATAIDQEAADWAIWFGVFADDRIEGRRRTMRANLAVGFDEPLRPYLEKLK